MLPLPAPILWVSAFQYPEYAPECLEYLSVPDNPVGAPWLYGRL